MQFARPDGLTLKLSLRDIGRCERTSSGDAHPLTPHARLKKINLNSQKMKVVQMATVCCQLFHNTGVLERDLKNKQEIGL